MRQAGESSVEEILESIKKVIARDNRAEAAEERRLRETAGMTSTSVETEPVRPAEEVLELGSSHDVVEEEDALSYDDEFDDEPDHAEPEAASDVPLVTEDARLSMRDSLTALAMMSAPGAPPQIVRSGETSLEGLTRDLLRPMLADWLEKNLPPIVDRMVAAEIARIAGKR